MLIIRLYLRHGHKKGTQNGNSCTMLHVYWMDNVLKNNDLLSQSFHNAQQAMLVCLP